MLSHTAQQLHPTRRLGIRIVTVVLIYSMGVAALISGLQIYRAYQLALVDVQERLIEIEKSYLPSLAGGMWAVDLVRMNALLDGIAQLPDVGRVVLVDELGQSWKRQHPLSGEALFSRSFNIVYHEAGESFRVGMLTVELMPANIHARLAETAKRIAITTSLTLFLSAFFVLFILRRWISRHLERMADYAQALDLKNLDIALKLDKNEGGQPDELDMVVQAINAMRLSIKGDIEKRDALDRELAAYRAHLEVLVAERTVDLQQKTQMLEIKSEELIQQNRELDAYAHTVAHDLKQPVSNLIGASSLLTADKLQLSPEKSQTLLISIQRSAQKLRSIIDSLLLLASLRKNDSIARSVIDIRHAALEACARLHDLAQQKQAQITLSEHWPAALGQQQWVEEIWANYLSNAIKYGGATPCIELGATVVQPGFVKCWTKDFGAGLNASQQQQIFDQFVRFDENAAEGHGLGLSIVKRIAQRLGGAVGYERSDDGASVFWFTLPLAE